MANAAGTGAPDGSPATHAVGLIPSWAKQASSGTKMLNARAEGIESKPSVKRPLRMQRCLLPTSAFFEWQGAPDQSPGAKTKFHIDRKDGELFGLDGLYALWKTPGGGALTTCRSLRARRMRSWSLSTPARR